MDWAGPDRTGEKPGTHPESQKFPESDLETNNDHERKSVINQSKRNIFTPIHKSLRLIIYGTKDYTILDVQFIKFDRKSSRFKFERKLYY